MNRGVVVSFDRVDVAATPSELSSTLLVASCDRVNVAATPSELSSTPLVASFDRVNVVATPPELSSTPLVVSFDRVDVSFAVLNQLLDRRSHCGGWRSLWACGLGGDRGMMQKELSYSLFRLQLNKGNLRMGKTFLPIYLNWYII
jgi:hypothetical protein